MLEREPIALGIAADLDGEAIAAQPNVSGLRPSQFTAWVKARKPELALLLGMTTASLVVSGAALAVLCSPNLGKTIAYDPLIDEATLAAGARTSLGEQILGKVARVLEIEIIETQGPGVGHRHRPVPAMVIVAQADQAAAMPEADLAVGLKAMALAAGVGLGVTGLMRLMPRLPLSALGPRRRQPLSQRLTAVEILDQPFAPVIAPVAVGKDASDSAPAQTLFPGALRSFAGLSVTDGRHEAAPAQKSPLDVSAQSFWQGLLASLTQRQLHLKRMALGDRSESSVRLAPGATAVRRTKPRASCQAIQPSVSRFQRGTASSNNAADIAQTAKPTAEGNQRNVDATQIAQARRSQSISFVPLSSLPLLSSSVVPAAKSARSVKHRTLLPEFGAETGQSRVLTSPLSARLDFLDELNLRKQSHKA